MTSPGTASPPTLLAQRRQERHLYRALAVPLIHLRRFRLTRSIQHLSRLHDTLRFPHRPLLSRTSALDHPHVRHQANIKAPQVLLQFRIHILLPKANLCDPRLSRVHRLAITSPPLRDMPRHSQEHRVTTTDLPLGRTQRQAIIKATLRRHLYRLYQELRVNHQAQRSGHLPSGTPTGPNQSQTTQAHTNPIKQVKRGRPKSLLNRAGLDPASRPIQLVARSCRDHRRFQPRPRVRPTLVHPTFVQVHLKR